jgi:cell wall assembly regulator SMI1
MSKGDVEAALRRMRDLVESLGEQPKWPAGATSKQLRAAEREAGLALDEEAHALFETLNGSARQSCVAVDTYGPVACELLGLDDALRLRPHGAIPWTRRFHYRGGLVAPDPRVQPYLAHPKWFPIAEVNGGSTLVLYDGAPAPPGRAGQIIAYQHDPDAVFWIASSVTAFLSASNALLEAQGRSLILGEPDAYTSASPTPYLGPTRTDRCVCSQHREPPRTIDALWERVTHTPDIKASLALVAGDEARGLTLLRCVVCGSLWQGSGGEVRTHAYVQGVPSIEAAAWRQQPFQEAWAVALYESAKADWLRRQKPGEGICQVKGCGRATIRFSVECLEHELAGLHERGGLRSPAGRSWPG